MATRAIVRRSRSRVLWGAAALAVVLGFGCASRPTNPYEFQNLRDLEPLPWYPQMLADMQVCVGPDGVYVLWESVEWLQADELRRTEDGALDGGVSYLYKNRIVVRSDYIEDPRVIAHELLHLVWGRPDAHTAPGFAACDPLAWMFR